MPFDGLMLGLVTAQLKECLINARIQRIYQPSKDDIIFYFSDSRLRPLLISANGNCARAHLTDSRYDNPETPPVFCMVLRKYLVGGIIKDIVQKDFDRILEVRVEALDEAGNLRKLSLIAEMMGKHSNITLVGPDMKILDAVKHISGLKNSYRRIMPGFDYIYPPNEKVNVFGGDFSTALGLLSFSGDRSPEKALVSAFSGISNQAAASFLLDEGIDAVRFSEIPRESVSLLPEKLLHFIERQLAAKTACTWYDEDGRAKDFTCGVYSALKGLRCEESDDPSAVVDRFYRDRSLVTSVRQQYDETIKKIAQIAERERKKLSLRLNELENASDCEIYNTCGNLLLSNMHLLKKGMESVTVQNFYDENWADMEIKLRPELTPSENAQYYFKRYNRAKSAEKHLEELIEESRRDTAFLDEQLYFLENCENFSEAEEILALVEKNGFIKMKKKKTGIKRPVKTEYLKYTSSDGYRILAGKNTIQNGELTFREAGKNDLWLHVKDVPASHVILFTNNGEYSDTALEEAAMIAVIHSDMKDSTRVSVDYTYAGNVKKIPGSSYANVTFTDNRTLIITPDYRRIEELKN